MHRANSLRVKSGPKKDGLSEADARCCIPETTERCLRNSCDASHVMTVAMSPSEIAANTSGMAWSSSTMRSSCPGNVHCRDSCASSLLCFQ